MPSRASADVRQPDPMLSSAESRTAPPAPEIPVMVVMGGLMLAILLGALEQTIVAVALPAIAGQFDGFALMGWVVSAYLVASTVVTPIYGKLSDLHGRRAMLSTAIALFVLASVACAMATSMPMLLVARAVQGLGGGGLISVAQATIADVVPLRERGRYQGYVSGMWAMASLAGPVIGGYLTHYLSWRWIFWINLPVGLVALAVARRTLRHLPVTHQRRPIDVAGVLLFAVGLTALLVMITRVGQGVPFAQPDNLGLLAVSVLVLGAFVWQENRAAEPIIPLSMFRVQTVTLCCLALFLCFFQLIATSVLMPLRFQMVAGAGPDIAALRLLPFTLATPVGAFVAGKWMTRSGRYKPLMVGGACVVPFAVAALGLLDPHNVWALTLAMMALGLAIGVQFPTGLVATQNAVPPQNVGLATALTAFSRLLGGAVGVAVLTSVLIALLRQAAPQTQAMAGSDLLMDLFHAALASKGADALALRSMGESAFRHLFFFAAAVSVISPLMLVRLEEKALRGRVPVAQTVVD
ncbi:MDR family MFS transporter [Ralstonia solanacearum]|uniref:MDR family MFS transporter n=1 Tax=Ralstonia solanacearum TaxID=305 RepID=UPI000E674ECB|nr:MDR family MFS transporter [Ralstonia solanacearum]RIJ84136.1 MFS transporter [Ralstonia solanacearum]